MAISCPIKCVRASDGERCVKSVPVPVRRETGLEVEQGVQSHHILERAGREKMQRL